MSITVRQFERVVTAGHSVVAGYSDLAAGADPTFAALAPLQTLLNTHFSATRAANIYPGTTAGTSRTASAVYDLGKPLLWQNSGVGGWTTTDIAANIASKITDYTPTLVLIMCSLNDAFANVSVPASFPPSLTQSNANTIISTIKGTLPNCRIGWISDLWLRSEQTPDGIGTYDSAVQLANAAVSAACTTSGATYIDIRARIWAYEAAHNTPAPGAASGILTQAAGPGTHPNVTGCSVISQYVFDLMALP